MAVAISRSLVARILAEAGRKPQVEVCGLLLGRAGRVEAVAPGENVADDPANRFEIDPATLIAAHRSARRDGPLVLGHYHSHPSGRLEPSAADALDAPPDGALWLIVAGGRIGLWRAGGAGLHGRFRAERLDLG